MTGGPSTHELPNGWTIDSLTRMAWRIVNTHPGLLLEREEAADVAAVALIEAVYSDPPSGEADLYRAARNALGTANNQQISYLGLETRPSQSGRTGTPPMFARYWHGMFSIIGPFEEAVVERVAMHQLWDALPADDKETLLTLAEHGSSKAACASLGLTMGRWYKRISRARRTARELWFWPEPPAPQWGQDRCCGGPDGQGRSPGLELNARRKRRKRAAERLARQEVAVS